MVAGDVLTGNRGDGSLLSVRKRLRQNITQRSSSDDLPYRGCCDFPFCLSYCCHDTAGVVLGKFPSGQGPFPPWRCQSSGFLVRRTHVRLRASPGFPCQNEKYLLSESETARVLSGVSEWKLGKPRRFTDRERKNT